jgi:hypothetical protein
MIEGEEDGARTSWTLGAIKARGLALEGHCQKPGCRQFVSFNVDSLIDVAGPGYVVRELIPGVQCRTCGGRLKFMLAMLPPEPEAEEEGAP